MRIVIDTNVIASAMFFGGRPRKLIELLVDNCYDAYANKDIIDEYNETAAGLKEDYPEKDIYFTLPDIIRKLHQIEAISKVHICRDPDDDKFIGCAIDSKSKYIVSGDKDLLEVGSYVNVEIVTVTEFLSENFPEDI